MDDWDWTGPRSPDRSDTSGGTPTPNIDLIRAALGQRVFTPLRPLYKVENTVARLGTWRRLSRCYEQTVLGAQAWLGVACVAYLCGRLRSSRRRSVAGL